MAFGDDEIGKVIRHVDFNPGDKRSALTAGIPLEILRGNDTRHATARVMTIDAASPASYRARNGTLTITSSSLPPT